MAALDSANAAALLQDNSGLGASDVTTSSSLHTTSVVIIMSYLFGATFAIMMSTAWGNVFTNMFSSFGWNPNTATVGKAIAITGVAILATVVLNKVAIAWANWETLTPSAPSTVAKKNKSAIRRGEEDEEKDE